MSSFAFAEFFYDHSIKIDELFWLPGCACEMPDGLSDILLEESEKMFGFALKDDSRDECEEWLSESARKKLFGYIVKVTTPIPSAFHGDGYTFSWGHCRVGEFYTEALDEQFLERLKVWQESVVADAKKRAAKGKAVQS